MIRFLKRLFNKSLKVKFAKIREGAVIPSKNREDAGFDLYACFDEESMIVDVGCVEVIKTGIKSAYSNTLMAMIKERGSTGFKAMSVKAGVMDSGFRNEWAVLLNNTNCLPIIITKETDETVLESLKDDYIVYPYSKAIAQFLFLPVPEIEIIETTVEDIDSTPSLRGFGMLGSSGK